MSLTAATARAPHRSLPVRDNAVRQLRLVSGRIEGAGSGMFAAFCLGLLTLGLLSVLMVNTFLAKGAFVLDDLQAQSGELAETQDVLQKSIDAKSAPAVLAQRALELGMVPSNSAAFLRLSDGKVLGVAEPATKAQGFSVVTSPVPVLPKAKPKPAAPRTVVTKSGSVTTTTVTTPKADGSVVVTVTSVDAKTKKQTVTTTITKPVQVTKPAATPSTAKPNTTKPNATKPSTGTTSSAGTGGQ